MPDPSISVVLPCHNGAATLSEAIESILNQSALDFELILFDDGSTDASLEVARTYQVRDDRVQIMGSDRVGLVEALSQACARARGEYIARMDADDLAHPRRFEQQRLYLEGRGDVGLCGTHVETLGQDVGPGRERYDSWINSFSSHAELMRELFVECPIAHPTFFMRREVYEKVGGYQDHGWPEDYDLVMRVVEAGYTLGTVPEVLLQWRHHPRRLSLRDERYELSRFRALKRHYLFRSYLANRRPFYQWGAGDVGKRWLREWDRGRPEAVVEIAPRKVGRVIHHTPVIAPEALPPADADPFIVAAVGAPGAREDIRRWLQLRNYRELVHFLFLA